VLKLRRENEQQEDDGAGEYDEWWGKIEDTHRTFVERFLSMLPPEGRVLDAACGTGKYFAIVLASGRSLLGVDHSAGMLATAAEKFPDVATEKHDLQNLPYRAEFDGVMCMDAMEFIPPEDWPDVLRRFRSALRHGGLLYLTVELALEEGVRKANEDARRAGLPVVDAEWAEPDRFYHHYPSMDRVRTWVLESGFAIVDEAEGPWHEEGYAYHHVLAREVPAAS
jgi:SAM-dependent methyltransferase